MRPSISFSRSSVQGVAMPIYAYKCSACGHEKDVLQKVSDDPLTQCPACGAPAFAKQLTAAGFQLKGSGWYATDFKNGSKKPADGKSDGKGADGKPADTGTESKPAESKPAETKAADSKPADSKPSPAAA